MTQKEKLIREYFKLKNQYDVLGGVENPWKAEPDAVDLYRWSSRNKVYELQEQIDRVKGCIERLTKEIERQKYFDTEEGKQVKETAEKNMEEARKQYEILCQTIGDEVKKLVAEALGQKFTTCFHACYDACYVDVHYTDDDYKPIFGHKFEIRYDKNFTHVDGQYNTRYELTMNYGTMGAFNLTDDFDMVNYLQGMAKFTADRNLQTKVVELFTKFINAKKSIDKFYYENEKIIKA